MNYIVRKHVFLPTFIRWVGWFFASICLFTLIGFLFLMNIDLLSADQIRLMKSGVGVWFSVVFSFYIACELWYSAIYNTPIRSLYVYPMATLYAISAGFAFYTNSVWLLWAIGITMPIGTVIAGHMAEYYWLGPFTLVYAVICYGAFKLKLWVDETDAKHKEKK